MAKKTKTVMLKEQNEKLSEYFSDVNVVHMKRFMAERNDLTDTTKLMYIRFMRNTNDWLDGKNFENIVEEDIVKLNDKLYNGVKWGWSNISTFINKFRAFSRWMLGLDSSEPLPKYYKKMVRPNPKEKPTRCTPEDTLKSNDVYKMIEACTNARDRWIVAGLFDTSFRPTEFTSITNKNIRLDSDGKYSVFCPKSKTYSRWCKLTYSDVYLKEWLRDHPFKKEDKFSLLPQLDGPNNESIGIESMNTIVKRASISGLNRSDVTSYHLRHAGLTEAGKILKGEQLNRYAGWTPGSKMSGIYLHYSDTDIGDVRSSAINVDGTYEPIKPEVNEIVKEQQTCLSCKIVNAWDSVFCVKCGTPMTIKAKIEDENNKEKLFKVLTAILKSKNLEEEQVRELISPLQVL
jgi:integrase